MYICKMHTTFWQTFVYTLYTKLKELCQLNFLYKMYKKVCWNVGYIFIQTFCIHFAYINSDPQFLQSSIHNYTIFIKHSHKTYIQIIVCWMVQHIISIISTYFDPFLVHFLVNHCKQLRLETCWLIMGGNYQINGLLDYILH